MVLSVEWGTGTGSISVQLFVIYLLRQVKRRVLLWILNLATLCYGNRWQQRLQQLLLTMLSVKRDGLGQLGEGFYVFYGRNLFLSRNVNAGCFCRIWDFSKVVIGDDCMISHNLTIVAGTHDVATREAISGEVTIGKGVWIGANVTIIGPVTIGDFSVIGAGAVVVKSIPANVVAAGVPCRTLRTLHEKQK